MGAVSGERFEALVKPGWIPWPRLESGRLDLERRHVSADGQGLPGIGADARVAGHSLGELRLNDLAVGRDGRNRALLSPFRSKTGRNQPSNSRSIMGPSVGCAG